MIRLKILTGILLIDIDYTCIAQRLSSTEVFVAFPEKIPYNLLLEP